MLKYEKKYIRFRSDEFSGPGPDLGGLRRKGRWCLVKSKVRSVAAGLAGPHVAAAEGALGCGAWLSGLSLCPLASREAALALGASVFSPVLYKKDGGSCPLCLSRLLAQGEGR